MDLRFAVLELCGQWRVVAVFSSRSNATVFARNLLGTHAMVEIDSVLSSEETENIFNGVEDLF